MPRSPPLDLAVPGPLHGATMRGSQGPSMPTPPGLWPSTHGAHSGLEGLWVVTLSPRLPLPGVPILAASFPVTSASSHDRFSRALWQDLECVCARRGVKGNVEEGVTLNPWPSVVSLSAPPPRTPAVTRAQRAPVPRRRHREMSPSCGQLGNYSWKACASVSPGQRPAEFYMLPELGDSLSCKTKCRMNRAKF